MISAEFAGTGDEEGLSYTIVAKDGIAVVVNKANTTDNLTLAQLKNLYDKAATGENKYASWSAIK
jgi:ABC-type phosphate transport system substrate-binding protein